MIFLNKVASKLFCWSHDVLKCFNKQDILFRKSNYLDHIIDNRRPRHLTPHMANEVVD